MKIAVFDEIYPDVGVNDVEEPDAAGRGEVCLDQRIDRCKGARPVGIIEDIHLGPR